MKFRLSVTLLPFWLDTLLPCYSATLLLCPFVTLLPSSLVPLLLCRQFFNFSVFLHDKSKFFSRKDAFFFLGGVSSWLNGLHYKSVFVQSNYWQSAFVGKFFLLWVLVDGNQTKVSFFENSAWTMTKALCLNAMAA